MLIIYARRFATSTFLADLRVTLGAADDAGCEAIEARVGAFFKARQQLAARAAPVVILGLPTLALTLAPFLREKLTLIIDGAEGIDAQRAKWLKALRVASFHFPLYTALRSAGGDAAFFTWAPPPAPVQELYERDAFIEAGAWPPFGVIAQIKDMLGAARIAMRRPQSPRERIGRLLCGDVQALAPELATQAEARAGVFLASATGGGLDGGFLPALVRGAVVIAPPKGLFAQYVTHRVSGLIEGGDIFASRTQMRDMRAAARRTATFARRRFEEDRERLHAFVKGEHLTRRTIARVDWRPTEASGALAPSGMREGGARLRGVIKQDAPDKPLVTVAIVVRNARESFAPTLASALAQDYPNVEIIAVDGDSTDGTRDEIAARDLELDYWISEADRGPYDGMNKAARLARGCFLIFMNAGDFFAHERAISETFESQAAREADVIVGHHVYVDASRVEKLCKNADFNQTYASLANGDLSWDWYNGAPCGQAVFIKSALLRELPFSLEYRIAADHNFLYEACARGHRFFHCDSIIGVYTSGGLSSANDRKTASELLRVARAYGPREKVDAWFRRNLPIAFEEAP